MRRSFWALVLTTASLLACDDDDDRYRRHHGGEHGILFGIAQKTDAASGKVTTTTGYEYLELDGKGWSQVRSQEDDECFFEELSTRLGRSHVEGGIARFRGGNLPGAGLVMLANQDGQSFDGQAFDTGDLLSFTVEGYALPPVGTVGLAAPATKVEIATPKDEALTLAPGADFDVAWTMDPEDRDRSALLVSFETESEAGRGLDVACFFKRQSQAKVPGALLRRLAPRGGEVKGTLDIATHSQVAVRARGGWTVYVIATALHRRQPFVLRAN